MGVDTVMDSGDGDVKKKADTAVEAPPKPVDYIKFLHKRFKTTPTNVLVSRLLTESDYSEYFPNFVANSLRRERVIELLGKSFLGESHKPTPLSGSETASGVTPTTV